MRLAHLLRAKLACKGHTLPRALEFTSLADREADMIVRCGLLLVRDHRLTAMHCKQSAKPVKRAEPDERRRRSCSELCAAICAQMHCSSLAESDLKHSFSELKPLESEHLLGQYSKDMPFLQQ